jgi:dTDP-glucose 4,6-dehydratase
VRVVITGAAGFLGSHLAERFVADGHEVVGVDNFASGRAENLRALEGEPRFTLVEGDVSAAMPTEAVRQRVHGVLHLASLASPVDYYEHPIATLDVGSVGTRNALEVARAHEARFLLASTSEVYGDPLVHPQPESYWGHVNPVGPRSCYDESKRFAEAMTMAYHRAHAVDTRIVRIFNTYGPRMRPHDGRVVSNFIVQALAGAPLTMYGDGSQTRSFCFVSDEVEGLYRLFLADAPSADVPAGAADGAPAGLDDVAPASRPLNIGNPGEFTVAELARLVVELTGSASTLERLPLPADDPRQRQPDIARARAWLGWEPRVALREGLAETIAYFRGVLGPAAASAPA